MMRSYKFVNDSGVELEVDCSYHIRGGDVEIESQVAWKWEDGNDPTAPNVELTEAENERFYNEVCLDESTWEYGDSG